MKSCRLDAQPLQGLGTAAGQFHKAVPLEFFSNRVSRYPHQKTRQPVSGENYPTVCNPACVNDMPHGKHRGRRYSLAIPISTPRRTDSPAITISDLRRNLVALLCPSLKVSVGKFGELAPLKLLTASKCRRVVSESREILA